MWIKLISLEHLKMLDQGKEVHLIVTDGVLVLQKNPETGTILMQFLTDVEAGDRLEGWGGEAQLFYGLKKAE